MHLEAEKNIDFYMKNEGYIDHPYRTDFDEDRLYHSDTEDSQTSEVMSALDIVLVILIDLILSYRTVL